MNSVGVPRTTPVASPLATSRSMRARTSAPADPCRSGRGQADLGRIRAKVVVLEGLLTVVQQVVHLPEAILTVAASAAADAASACGWISVSGKCRNAKRTSSGNSRSTCWIARNACREWALVVAVLEDDRRVRGATHVIDVRVEGPDLIGGLHLGPALVLG